jgi:hypothetical protein
VADQLAQVVDFARQQIGDPYKWGAVGPDAFDCSGLVYAAYKFAGIPVARVTAAQFGKGGREVPMADAKPGQVVYIDEPGAVDHVGIFIGNGQMIDAPTEGKPVGIHNISAYRGKVQIRDLGATGDGSSTSALDAITDPIGTGMALVNDAISTTFGSWQSDIFGLGLKVLAGVACVALLVVGAKTAFDGDDE